MPQPGTNHVTQAKPPQPGLATSGGIQQAQMKAGSYLNLEARPDTLKRSADGMYVPGRLGEDVTHLPDNTGILQRTAHLIGKEASEKRLYIPTDRSGHSSEAARYKGIATADCQESARSILTKFAMGMAQPQPPQQGFAPPPDATGAPSTAPMAVGGPGMPPAAPPPMVDPATGQPVGGGAAPGAPMPPAGPGELPPGGAMPGQPTMGGMTPPMGEPPVAPLGTLNGNIWLNEPPIHVTPDRTSHDADEGSVLIHVT